jgi:DNA-binding response OmpR family regulator
MASDNILLIDNDPGLLGLLTLELEQEGYQVQSYASAEEALAARLEPPALAVLDYHLPGMDGLVLLEQLRQHYPCLPALIISSECRRQYLPVGSNLPATHLLRKPFSHDTFMDNVTVLLTMGTVHEGTSADCRRRRCSQFLPGDTFQ